MKRMENMVSELLPALDTLTAQLSHLNPINLACKIVESSQGEGFCVSSVYVKGNVSNRVVFFSAFDLIYIYSESKKFQDLLEIYPVLSEIEIKNMNSRLSECTLNQTQIKALDSPTIQLIVLCHKEYFPLPRFALGVADLAASIRRGFWGSVSIADMQLDNSLCNLIASITVEKPDIIGISITFGQDDILHELLKEVCSITDYSPTIIVGGSLAFLNQHSLLEKYDNIFVCTGYGEQSILGLVKYINGDIKKEQIVGVLYKDNKGQIIRTKNAFGLYDGIPELDKLDEILSAQGVILLETSRGCINDCSFCPRSHKGKWNSLNLLSLANLIPRISQIYDNHPDISKRIFFIDEEFIGSATNEEFSSKVDTICGLLSKYGFRYEISSRISQICDKSKDEKWHVERLKLWTKMKDFGLNRCLFGIESGVDSILKRFNKNVSSQENKLALRTLSTFGIPFRVTYITFDPLMSIDELIESYIYQGRTDLILTYNPLFSPEEASILSDCEYVTANSSNIPLFSRISYMLVSLECLINTPYANLMIENNLVKSKNTQMGKYDVSYLDVRIGLMSHYCQLWIDKNFALDYLLKSLLKTRSQNKSKSIENMRYIIRKHSYAVLGKFLVCATQDTNTVPGLMADNSLAQLRSLYETSSLETALQIIIEKQHEELAHEMHTSLDNLSADLQIWESELVKNQLEKWTTKSDWRLING